MKRLERLSSFSAVGGTDAKDVNPGGVNFVNGKTFQELRQNTEEKIKLLENCGFRV